MTDPLTNNPYRTLILAIQEIIDGDPSVLAALQVSGGTSQESLEALFATAPFSDLYASILDAEDDQVFWFGVNWMVQTVLELAGSNGGL